MADHADFIDDDISDSNRIDSAWLNPVNRFVYRGVNPIFVTSTGSADAYVVTLPDSLLTTLVDGQKLAFKANFTNGGPATLEAVGQSSTGALAITVNGNPLSGGELVVDTYVEVAYLNGEWNIAGGASGSINNLIVNNSTTLNGVTNVNLLNPGDTFTVTTIGGTTFQIDAAGNIDMSGATSVNYLNGSVLVEDLSQEVLNLIASSAASGTIYSVRGLIAQNNSGTPNTKCDIAYDAAVTADPSTGAVTTLTAGADTNDVGLTGPALNGRDQSGAFTANDYVHFYIISNAAGTLKSTISSQTLPADGGPDLTGLTGYTRWAYTHSQFFDVSSHLVGLTVYGRLAVYTATQVALINGAATSPTSVDIAALAPDPSVCSSFTMLGGLTITTAGGGGLVTFTTQYTSTNTGSLMDVGGNMTGPNLFTINASTGTFPNVDQTFHYSTTLSNGSGPKAYAQVLSYNLKNGDA